MIARLFLVTPEGRRVLGAALLVVAAALAAVTALWLWNALLAVVAGTFLGIAIEQLIRSLFAMARPISKEHRRVVRKVESALRQADLQHEQEAAS